MAKFVIHVILIFAFLGAINCGVFDKKAEDNFEDLQEKDDAARVEEKADLQEKDDAARVEEKAGLFEGDIDMDDSMKEALIGGKITPRDALWNPIYHWPNAKLYFKFHRSLSHFAMYRIHMAMQHIETETCVRFEYYNGQPATNYVVFFKGRGCYSRIGRNSRGRSQKISIGRGCTRVGTIVHEIMHALGFFHEQSRQDRDKFVKIMWNNIERKHSHNFRKYPRLLGTNLGKPYDYRSVMHYSKYAFSRNRKPTIIPRKRGVKIGQRFGLSYYDAYQINKLYKCRPLCVDKIHPFVCEYYKNRGYCHHTYHGKDVNLLCKRTCTLCGRYIQTFK